MSWTLEEAVSYYKTQGAPQNQTALINLLREIQTEQGGGIPSYILTSIAAAYGVKESFLQAVIKRIPSLRLENTHCLELCAGPNCGKHKTLAACAKELSAGGRFTLKFTPCMRMCGKGPNLRWDGKLYHQATEELLHSLAKQADAT
jgi:NADH:ubiquinone oxidoreductase subunit E